MLEEMSSTKSAHLVEVVGATQINTHGSTNMAVECLTDEEILSEMVDILKRLGYTPDELWRKYHTYTLDEEECRLARRYYLLSWLLGYPSPKED